MHLLTCIPSHRIGNMATRSCCKTERRFDVNKHPFSRATGTNHPNHLSLLLLSLANVLLVNMLCRLLFVNVCTFRGSGVFALLCFVHVFKPLFGCISPAHLIIDKWQRYCQLGKTYSHATLETTVGIKHMKLHLKAAEHPNGQLTTRHNPVLNKYI